MFTRQDIDAGIQLILDKLAEEDREELEEYIINLLQEIDEIQSDLNSTEEDLREVENELDNKNYDIEHRCNYCDYCNCMHEIVNDQMYVTKSYDTKEKILDKIEHTLKYGSPEKIWM